MQYLKTMIAPRPDSIEVSITGSVVSFSKEQSGYDTVSATADLEEIVARYSQDHGVVAVGHDRAGLLVVETTALSVSYRNLPLAGVEGATRRDSPISAYRSVGGVGYPALFLLTPTRGCGLAECFIYFFGYAAAAGDPLSAAGASNAPGHATFIVNGQEPAAQDVGLLPSYLATWLPISLVGSRSVPSGGAIPLVVDAPNGADVFLEPVVGSTSRSRARNGDVVMLHATDLPPGTKARVKAGYKYWPGKADILVDVV